jgi:hypothetical protein
MTSLYSLPLVNLKSKKYSKNFFAASLALEEKGFGIRRAARFRGFAGMRSGRMALSFLKALARARRGPPGAVVLGKSR